MNLSLEWDKYSGKARLVMNWSLENCLYQQSSLNLRATGRRLGYNSYAEKFGGRVAFLVSLSSQENHLQIEGE